MKALVQVTEGRLRSRASAGGYTAVEVLMAMTLFAIGAAGVISMQKVTIQGGEDARRFDMATNIANEWLSRLQRDASFWTQPNSEFPQTTNINQTKWLSTVAACANAFCTPPTPPGPGFDGESGAFDGFGRDVDPAGGQARFCVQYRLTWIADPGPTGTQLISLLRADVRVYYTRLEAAPIANCTQATAPPEALPVAPAVSPFHFVYASTAIRENQRR